MKASGRGPVALQSLKRCVGNLYHPFLGGEQQDSHEFLMFLLSWVHEDLTGKVSVRDASGADSVH